MARANELPYNNFLPAGRHSQESLANSFATTVKSNGTDATDATAAPLLPGQGQGQGRPANGIKAPRTRIHELSSPSGAIQLELTSIGSSDTPVYMQHIFPVISGHVSANLADGHATQVRVQVKGVLASVAGQTTPSYNAGEMGGAPFWQDSKVVWQTGDSVDAAGLTDEIPFSFRIPEFVHMPINFGDIVRCPTPPSYIFKSDFDRKKSEILASSRFTLKVVIEKKGLSNRDEKLSVPLTYQLETQSINFIPAPRRAALLNGTPLPGPSSDPGNWETHKIQKTITKAGLFTLKDIDVAVQIRLPKPLLCAFGERLPYFVSMAAPNLKKLGGSALGIRLIERRWTGSGGLGPGECFEMVISTGTAEQDTAEGADDPTVRAYKGLITLQGATSPSFRTPKLEVQHTLIIVMLENGVMKDEVASVPITLFHVSQ